MDYNIQIQKNANSYRRHFDKMNRAKEIKLLQSYKESLKEIKKQVADMFSKYGDKITLEEMKAYNRLTNLEYNIAQEIKKLNGKLINTTKTTIKDAFKTSYNWTGYNYETTLGLAMGFGNLPTSAIQSAILNKYDTIKWSERLLANQKVYVRQIREEITKGLIQGKGYGAIAKSINERADIGATKVLRIVKTETHRASAEGTLKAYDRVLSAAEDLNIEMRKRWMSTLDARTRDVHADMDGEFADDEGMFTFPDGVVTELPGLSGDPAQDIHCRCTSTLEVEGLDENKRRDNESKQIINYKTYEDWSKGKGIN